MLFHIVAALRDRQSESGQGLAEYFLIVAPLSAFLALTVCTFIIASHR
jgi:hypothetical protein